MKLSEGILDCIFPDVCCVCHKPGAVLCSECSLSVKHSNHPLCISCGLSFAPDARDHMCSECETDKPYYDRHRTCVVYKDSVRDLIHRFKYGADFSVLHWIHKICLPEKLDFDDVDCIVPIPLAMKRLKQRGFNQSLEISKIVSRKYKIKIQNHMLFRIRESQSQTSLNKIERAHNMRNAFFVAKRERVRGKTILLVDDVYTTGATLNEAAKKLKEAGANSVYALTIARGQI